MTNKDHLDLVNAVNEPLQALKALSYLISIANDDLQDTERFGIYWLLDKIHDSIEDAINATKPSPCPVRPS